MLKPTGEKIHLSVNVEYNYFTTLDSLTPVEVLKIVRSCLVGNKEIMNTIITSYKDNRPDVMLYLSEVINAGIRNGEEK